MDFSNVAIPGLSQTTVNGLSELDAKLKELAPALARRAFREAGRAAADIWVQAMKELAPVLSQSTKEREAGLLRDSIGASVTISKVNEAMIVHVGPGKQAFYAGFDEFGTRRMGAHPFMRPAFQNHQDDVLNVFVDELWQALGELAE